MALDEETKKAPLCVMAFSLRLALLVAPDEGLDRAVVGFFHLWWEEASRQFAALPVVGHALAAETLPFTVGIGAGALFQVFLFPALHENHLRREQIRRKPAASFWLAVFSDRVN
jgi:hypothetical protein